MTEENPLAYSVWVWNTHIAIMDRINTVKSFILVMFTVQWKTQGGAE